MKRLTGNEETTGTREQELAKTGLHTHKWKRRKWHNEEEE